MPRAPLRPPRIAPFLALLVLVIVVTLALNAGSAQAAPRPQEPPEEPPFSLPFAEPPGLSTWFVVQWYGNTRSAYRFRQVWYRSGQGLHFGLDFAAPCGTEVLAIADGVVTKIDAPEHGAGPHSLMLIHYDTTLASFYGHLLERPDLVVGQPVHRGDVIGLTGDPDLTCNSRPHLHLEIRDRTYWNAYNPVLYIDADWDSIALLDMYSPFQRDLDHPRQWVTPYDQPDVLFGAPMLNEYRTTWPPLWW